MATAFPWPDWYTRPQGRSCFPTAIAESTQGIKCRWRGSRDPNLAPAGLRWATLCPLHGTHQTHKAVWCSDTHQFSWLLPLDRNHTPAKGIWGTRRMLRKVQMHWIALWSFTYSRDEGQAKTHTSSAKAQVRPSSRPGLKEPDVTSLCRDEPEASKGSYARSCQHHTACPTWLPFREVHEL